MDKTLLSLAAVSVLFFALLLSAIGVSIRTELLCSELLTSAEQCLAAVRAEALSDAEVQLTALRTDWESHRLFFSATQSHADIDAINTALKAASLQLSRECSDELYAELAEVMENIKKIGEIQQFSLENIL